MYEALVAFSAYDELNAYDELVDPEAYDALLTESNPYGPYTLEELI